MGLCDVTVTITRSERDRRIAWTVVGRARPPVGPEYGYLLAPAPGGATLVTSSCDGSPIDRVSRERDVVPLISAPALRRPSASSPARSSRAPRRP